MILLQDARVIVNAKVDAHADEHREDASEGAVELGRRVQLREYRQQQEKSVGQQRDADCPPIHQRFTKDARCRNDWERSGIELVGVKASSRVRAM